MVHQTWRVCTSPARTSALEHHVAGDGRIMPRVDPWLGLALRSSSSEHWGMNLARCAGYCALRDVSLFAALVSVASAQDQTWIRQFGTAVEDHVYSSAPDDSGGVYVSGATNGNLGAPHAGSDDVWLARYDGAGHRAWIRQFGTGGSEFAVATSHDGTGGVYISGHTTDSLVGSSAGREEVWIARYDGAGTQTWIRQFGSSDWDFALAAAPDGSAGVFISGITNGRLGAPSAGGADAWLARYDSAGNQTWIRQVGSSATEWAQAVAPDGSGGVFVTGSTLGSLGAPTAGSFDNWLARYDSTGNQTWIRQFGTDEYDYASSVTPDGAGGMYLSGYTYGSLGGPSAGDRDVWLARYDGGGNRTWIRQFGSAALDVAMATAPAGSSGVFVGGYTDGNLVGQNAGDRDIWIARYDGAGTQSWIRQSGTNDYDHASTLAPDGSGGVYLSGYTTGTLGATGAGGMDAWLARYEGGLDAARYCTPGVPSSTGQPGVIAATGSNVVQGNDVTLMASNLPLHSFGLFLTSRDQGNTYPVNNSQGRLCLGGSIGRYVGPGQIKNSGTSGAFSLAIDLTSLPQPLGHVTAQPGDAWSFQTWYRDANPTSTSNFTDAVTVTFD
jgi:hypothetical protein